MFPAIDAAVRFLHAQGIDLPADLAADIDALKARGKRDSREPQRKKKQALQDEISAVIFARFQKQAAQLKKHLQQQHPDRKAVAPPLPPIDDSEEIARLVALLTQALQDGIILFGDTAGPQIDYTLTNAQAAAFARQYAFDLVSGIDATSREALQSIISSFVETPGMTIGDVMNLLPYNEVRAQMIATTEITRAYAQGQQMAGEALKKEWPDVRVMKQWFTNNDDRVCEICGPLNGKEAAIDEKWPGGIDNPPAHVNCRCWTESYTALGKE